VDEQAAGLGPLPVQASNWGKFNRPIRGVFIRR
jgi:hypothetical protein